VRAQQLVAGFGPVYLMRVGPAGKPKKTKTKLCAFLSSFSLLSYPVETRPPLFDAGYPGSLFCQGPVPLIVYISLVST
jgi:hypothetical protein